MTYRSNFVIILLTDLLSVYYLINYIFYKVIGRMALKVNSILKNNLITQTGNCPDKIGEESPNFIEQGAG